jgi:acetylornithine deacetylase/succinyl-diaminopimelate desuccinylase-like protein
MIGLDNALAYMRGNRKRCEDELAAFIRFASVSAQPEHAREVTRCAAWLKEHLATLAPDMLRVVSTQRHPIVHAAWRRAACGGPTVLIYGHYDVQPAEPLEEWLSPPFAPVVRGDDIYGRGASDNKGQMFAHVKAIESFVRTTGALPVNVICLFEGEEEIGSPSLSPFLNANRSELAADCAVVSDMQIPGPRRPAITYALRGGLSVEIEARGANRELHSGVFGGAVCNPLQALCEMIARLHDSRGAIASPGFYDWVRRWDRGERRYMAEVGPSDAEMLRRAGASKACGEPGYSLYERTTIRPALTVSGVMGGYNGPGVKAAIPTRAVAKLNFRLVPDQDPCEIERLLREHVARIRPSAVQTAVRTLMLARPALIDRTDRAIIAAARAYRQAFGAPPVSLRNGGTIPIVTLIQDVLRIPIVLMGFGLASDAIHGPNERFHLPNFHRGIETSIRFLSEMGAQPQTSHSKFSRRAPIAPQKELVA